MAAWFTGASSIQRHGYGPGHDDEVHPMSHQASEIMAGDHTRALLRDAQVRRIIRRRRGATVKRTSTVAPLPVRRPTAEPAGSLPLRQV